MKTWATILLISAFVGVIVSWPFRHNFWGGLVLAGFEASLVGALADWFAVVALFRHPLGLKFIPHTAIIPNNKQRIIDGIAYLVENEWLKLSLLNQKIQDYPLIEKVSEALQSDEGKKRLDELISSVMINVIKNINPEDIADFLQNVIERDCKIKISAELIGNLEKSIKELYGDDILDFLLDSISELINSEDFYVFTAKTLQKAADDYARGNILRRFGKGIGEKLDVINYYEAANVLVNKLSDRLRELKFRGNPFRAKIKVGLINFKIIGRANLPVFLEGWLKRFLEDEDGKRALIDIITAIKYNLFNDFNNKDEKDSVLVRYFADIIINQVNIIKSDEKRRIYLERWLKAEAIKMAERYHNVIGKLVKENLQVLDEEGFVESIEEHVGEDLQWIRINGTVIGGIVGVMQYLILHWVLAGFN